jgi:hypothetical protein
MRVVDHLSAILADRVSQALKIASPEEEDFVLRWPLSKGTFNTVDYSSSAEVLADIQDILTSILAVDFEIPVASFGVRSESRTNASLMLERRNTPSSSSFPTPTMPSTSTR